MQHGGVFWRGSGGRGHSAVEHDGMFLEESRSGLSEDKEGIGISDGGSAIGETPSQYHTVGPAEIAYRTTADPLPCLPLLLPTRIIHQDGNAATQGAYSCLPQTHPHEIH